MKALIFTSILLFSNQINAQNMEPINQTVTRLFVATDQHDWAAVEALFAPEVNLDYSSFTGNPAVSLTPKQITQSWAGFLPGFEHTHHQLGNFISEMKEGTARVFCYGTATHYLTAEGGNVWIVVGSYDFDLSQNAEGQWQVTSMKFNFKYQDGNGKLPELAAAKMQ